VQPIAGRPGAGKTFALEAVVAAYTARGIPVLGCAVSATAAAQLEAAAGFTRSLGVPAQTVARLLLDLDDPQCGGLAPGTVIVVDEASMLGTRDLARLASHAATAGGAIKLVGDPLQHGAVEAGGVFARLCIDAGSELVQLVENNRQVDPDERLAVAEYREVRIAEAIARYDDAGRITRSRTAGESYDAMVADWYAARTHGEADPMIAGPNSIRRALNDRARVLLKANGQLTGPAVRVGGSEFCVGDEVIARRNDRRLRAAGVRDFVKNGSIGTVTQIDEQRGEIVVDFRREGAVCLPRHYIAGGYLEHAYALTTYAVQGATLAASRYHPTDGSSFEEGYVALTRGRDGTRLYLIDGTSAPDDETSHVPPAPESSGLVEIIESMSRRRANAMVHDVAAEANDVARAAAEMRLAHLRAERRRLLRVLDRSPRLPRPTSAELECQEDSARARRRAREELSHGHAAQPEGQPTRTRARRTAALIAEEKLKGWLDTHEPVRRRASVVGRAAQARGARVRTMARMVNEYSGSQREYLVRVRNAVRDGLQHDV
jgi:hypothetical protein